MWANKLNKFNNNTHQNLHFSNSLLIQMLRNVLRDSTGDQQKNKTIPSSLCWLCFRSHILTREYSCHAAILASSRPRLLSERKYWRESGGGGVARKWFGKKYGDGKNCQTRRSRNWRKSRQVQIIDEFNSFPAFVSQCSTFFRFFLRHVVCSKTLW